MPDTAVPHRTPAAVDVRTSAHRDRDLERLIQHAAHLLPSQGPLSVFVHHNTLHAFEDLPFAAALEQASEVYDCQPYLAEERYRRELARGRIRPDDLAAVLHDDLGDRADDLIGLLGTRFYLRLAMLQFPLRLAPGAELRWIVAETDALRKFRADVPAHLRRRTIDGTRRWIMRDFGAECCATTVAADVKSNEAGALVSELLNRFGASSIEQWSEATWEAFTLQLLWRVCCIGVERGQRLAPPPAAPLRHRDALRDATGQDSDELVHDVLIRFCSAFLDQGFAHWPLPERDRGFYHSYLALYSLPGGVLPRWARGLRSELRRLQDDAVGPLASIEESLDVLGVEEPHREHFLLETLLALRGWAGMIWQMETNADWAVRPAPRGSLVEFLAIRLLLDRFAAAHIAKEHLGRRGPLQGLRDAALQQRSAGNGEGNVQRAFLFFQLAQMLGLKPEEFFRLPLQTWGRLAHEVDSFSQLERRRTLHLAYERAYRNRALDALARYVPERRTLDQAPGDNSVPTFQFISCIDDREESLRRHLEEIDPRCETFGSAGFFGVAMYYRGASDAYSRPLCPVVIKPQHYVEELPVFSFEESHRRRVRTRRLVGAALHHAHWGSRSFLAGAVTALLGSLASFPLVARIHFPRIAARLRGLAGSFVQPPPVTQLLLERSAPTPGPEDDQIGYSLDEMAAVVERTLRDMGLTARFAPLVIVCGHGSSSLNNPHESAYNCGACSGGRGGPNARAFAQMANDRRVRDLLEARGLHVPDATYFLGALHNTCDDSVEFFDLDRLPPTHRALLARTELTIDEARERNAHERCRRFESVELNLPPEAALRRVEARAEDLSQARPEYNHATSALCFVGRRSSTRGLFMDRRAFLASYDADQDDAEGAMLARVLQAVVPVCAGISLEYYFSCVDVHGYGCGSKLPHNIAALLGVMEGAASDLRTGLSAQMIEIHEPMRILFVVETTPRIMEGIIAANPVIGRLCRNEWAQLATLSPDGSAVHLYRRGQFERYHPESADLPEAASSLAWYRGRRDHLGFAVVREPNVDGGAGGSAAP